jgi:3-(3-hydroxy-phenyl)propionate hydroxylase
MITMPEETAPEDVDVAIVGYGPVGAAAANLLAPSGLRIAVFDAATGIYDKPRAIVVDHEALRMLQMCRLPGDLSELFSPYRGSHYVGVDGQVIRRFYPLPGTQRLGWPTSATFIQPEVERALRAGVAQHPNVDVRLGYQMTSLSDGAAAATLQFTELANGHVHRVRARYVFGCDGARSAVRSVIGTGFDDLAFDERWLVVDAWLTGAADLPELSIQYCQPKRPATFVLGPRNLRRWELKLLPGEDPDAFSRTDVIKTVLSDYVDVGAIDIWRSSVYRFHALVAERWRRGRIFILGDAAHQTPPFSGQGLCSGLRDVANLAWKVRHVEELGAEASLLDSYEAERKPHFRSVVARSLEIGKIVGELDLSRARARDKAMLAELDLGADGHPTYRQSGIPPLVTGVIGPAGHADPWAGTLFIQPGVRLGNSPAVLLEDVLDMRFALFCEDNEVLQWFDDDAARVWQRIGAQRVLIQPPGSQPAACPDGVVGLSGVDNLLADWLRTAGCRAVIVRPDRYVYGVLRSSADLRRLTTKLAADLFCERTIR